MKDKNLEMDLHNYFKDYAKFSEKYELSPNKNEYGIIFNERELKEINNNIKQILEEEENNYYFIPSENIIGNNIPTYSSKSIILNKNMEEFNQINKDYNKRISKFNKINECDEKQNDNIKKNE